MTVMTKEGACLSPAVTGGMSPSGDGNGDSRGCDDARLGMAASLRPSSFSMRQARSCWSNTDISSLNAPICRIGISGVARAYRGKSPSADKTRCTNVARLAILGFATTPSSARCARVCHHGPLANEQ